MALGALLTGYLVVSEASELWRNTCWVFLAVVSAAYLFAAAMLFALAFMLGGMNALLVVGHRHLYT